MLELDGLDVRHGAVHAVRGLSLSVDRGEIVGLIGANGAGKSSTLHAVMGLVPAAAGDVRLHGRSLVGRAPEDVARAGVALVPEGRRIFAELTVEENLRLGVAGRPNGDLARAYELFPVVKEFRRRPPVRPVLQPNASYTLLFFQGFPVLNDRSTVSFGSVETVFPPRPEQGAVAAEYT